MCIQSRTPPLSNLTMRGPSECMRQSQRSEKVVEMLNVRELVALVRCCMTTEQMKDTMFDFAIVIFVVWESFAPSH